MWPICHHLSSSPYYQFAIIVYYGVVLLLGVVSLMTGSTTGVPMSPGCGGYQTTSPPSYYTTTYATSDYYIVSVKYYSTKVPEYYTKTYGASSYYTEAPKYNFAPNYITTGPEYYTTKTPKYYETAYAVPAYYTDPQTPKRQQRQPAEGKLSMASCCCYVLRVVSLMAGLTNGVPMSPGYGGYHTTSPTPTAQ